MGSTVISISEEMSVNRLVNPRKSILPPTRLRLGREAGRRLLLREVTVGC
jgi:hypothetical protein